MFFAAGFAALRGGLRQRLPPVGFAFGPQRSGSRPTWLRPELTLAQRHGLDASNVFAQRAHLGDAFRLPHLHLEATGGVQAAPPIPRPDGSGSSSPRFRLQSVLYIRYPHITIFDFRHAAGARSTPLSNVFAYRLYGAPPCASRTRRRVTNFVRNGNLCAARRIASVFASKRYAFHLEQNLAPPDRPPPSDQERLYLYPYGVSAGLVTGLSWKRRSHTFPPCLIKRAA